jgi:hypothetical protein
MTDEPTIPPSMKETPSEPPPIPPAPLAYAGPMPPSEPSGKANFSQQAAQASWLAPIIAFVLNLFTNAAPDRNLGSSNLYLHIIILIINVCLIALGLVFGIVALCGIRRHGKYRILTPAIVGISINGFFILLIAAALMVAGVARSRASGRARSVGVPARAPVTVQQARDSMEKSPGWVGNTTKDGAFIVVASIGADTPLGQEMKDLFGTDRLAFAIVVNNSAGTAPITVNASDFSVVYKDGTIHPAISPDQVFKAARLNANTLKAAYPPSVSIAARAPAASSVAAFLPVDIDPAQIDHATVIVHGKLLTIPGKFQSVEEKAANIARANAATTLPAAP